MKKDKLKLFVENKENRMLTIWLFTLISYVVLLRFSVNTVVLLCAYFVFYFIYSKLYDFLYKILFRR